MNLDCPSCGTTLRLPEGALGEKGRKLRCAACKHIWFQKPVGDPPVAGAAAPSPPEPAAPAVPSDDETAGPEPVRKPVGGRLLALFLLLAVAGGLFCGHHWRAPIMRAAPWTVELYDTIGWVGPPASHGLEFRDLAFSFEERDGRPLLVVSGRIVNPGDDLVRLPRLRAEILDAASRPLRDWTFAAPAPALGPGDTASFRSVYPDPPRTDGAPRYSVTFEDVR